MNDDKYTSAGEFKIDSVAEFKETRYIESLTGSWPESKELEKSPIDWSDVKVQFYQSAPKKVVDFADFDEDWNKVLEKHIEAEPAKEVSDPFSVVEIFKEPRELSAHLDSGWNILNSNIFKTVKHNFVPGQVKIKIPNHSTVEYTYMGVKGSSPNRIIHVSFQDVVGRLRTDYLDMEMYDMVYKYAGSTARKITASEMKSTLVRKPWQKTT